MLPVSLYIHIPWCIRKCPYCDFNSHKSPGQLPEQHYIDALLADFKQDLSHFPHRFIHSIFIGGGTPSLLSADAYHSLLTELQKHVTFAPELEVTMEANPGTVEQQRFNDYRQAGINRLSLGIQSFNADKLKTLGRIHDDKQAHKAIETARRAGFDNLNIDIMHSLPGQSAAEGLADLTTALTHQPEHLSWYQLTIEPNTIFYKQQPQLPDEDTNEALELEGFERLAAYGFQRYEISAFSKPGRQSRHNLNYWLFGDYYGIGAGAHGKLTVSAPHQIYRTRKQRQPTDYLNPDKQIMAASELLSADSLPFEFMLNTTRLQQPIPLSLFTERTGLDSELLQPRLEKAASLGLITLNDKHWQVTEFGRRYTNNLQEMFLPEQVIT
ncbi:radical SAM family heme chaperone HemW [Legionella dresdenensis]|uniref:Heme chaperone HemW n=1 Tax=Legionella dresdenensis TaxID=450200 RepID=A0ABV8CI28_9GAMM